MTPQWRLIGLRSQLIHSIAVAPNSGALYVATDRGLFERSQKSDWHPEIRRHEIWDVDVSSDGRVVAVAENSGDVAVSRDFGSRWKTRLLTSAGGYAIAIRPSDSRWIVAGMGNGVYLSTNEGGTWRKALALKGRAVDAFTWVPSKPGYVIAGTVGAAPDATSSSAFLSRNGGQTWRPYGRDLPIAGVMSLAGGPRGQILAGTMGHAVWRQVTGHWVRSAGGMPLIADHGSSLLFVRRRRLIVFVATLGFGVFRSSDDGVSWQSFGSGLPGGRRNTVVLSLGWDHSRHMLLAGTPNGIYGLTLR